MTKTPEDLKNVNDYAQYLVEGDYSPMTDAERATVLSFAAWLIAYRPAEPLPEDRRKILDTAHAAAESLQTFLYDKGHTEDYETALIDAIFDGQKAALCAPVVDVERIVDEIFIDSKSEDKSEKHIIRAYVKLIIAKLNPQGHLQPKESKDED